MNVARRTARIRSTPPPYTYNESCQARGVDGQRVPRGVDVPKITYVTLYPAGVTLKTTGRQQEVARSFRCSRRRERNGPPIVNCQLLAPICSLPVCWLSPLPNLLCPGVDLRQTVLGYCWVGLGTCSMEGLLEFGDRLPLQRMNCSIQQRLV